MSPGYSTTDQWFTSFASSPGSSSTATSVCAQLKPLAGPLVDIDSKVRHETQFPLMLLNQAICPRKSKAGSFFGNCSQCLFTGTPHCRGHACSVLLAPRATAGPGPIVTSAPTCSRSLRCPAWPAQRSPPMQPKLRADWNIATRGAIIQSTERGTPCHIPRAFGAATSNRRPAGTTS